MTTQGNGLPFKTKAAYGVAAFSEGMVGMALAFALLRFYTNVVGVSGTTVGLALLAPRIWDAVSDPMMGYLSDHTKSRLGRRRPYLLYGAVPLGLSFLLLWIPSSAWPMWAKVTHLAAASLVWNTMHTIVIMPYWALGAELSPDYHERTSIAAYRQFFFILGAFPGSFVYSFVARFSSEATGFAVMGALGGVALVVSFLVTFATTRENPEFQSRGRMPILPSIKETFRNRSFNLFLPAFLMVGWAFAYGGGFWPYIILDVVKKGADWMSLCLVLINLSSIVFLPLYLALSRRVGKKNAFVVNLIAYSLLQGSGFVLLTEHMPKLSLVFSSLCGLGLGGFMALASSIMADVIDEDELVTGKRREGAFFGLQNVLTKSIGAVATLVVGATLDWSGYDYTAGAVQTADTILKLKFFYAVFPAMIFLVTAIYFHFIFPLTPQRAAEVRAELDRRADQGETTSAS